MRDAQSEDSGGCVRVICLVIVCPLVSGQQQNEQQRQQHRQRHDGRDEQRLDLDAVGDEPDGRFLLLGFNAVAAHQKPVGVDAVGRASDKRTQVFSGLNLQGSDVLRLDDQDAVNLVGQNLVEHADDERIAFDNLIEIGKQLCAGQSAMAGEDAVCAFAADRETCPVQMSDRDLQNGIAVPW